MDYFWLGKLPDLLENSAQNNQFDCEQPSAKIQIKETVQ